MLLARRGRYRDVCFRSKPSLESRVLLLANQSRFSLRNRCQSMGWPVKISKSISMSNVARALPLSSLTSMKGGGALPSDDGGSSDSAGDRQSRVDSSTYPMRSSRVSTPSATRGRSSHCISNCCLRPTRSPRRSQTFRPATRDPSSSMVNRARSNRRADPTSRAR